MDKSENKTELNTNAKRLLEAYTTRLKPISDVLEKFDILTKLEKALKNDFDGISVDIPEKYRNEYFQNLVEQQCSKLKIDNYVRINCDSKNFKIVYKTILPLSSFFENVSILKRFEDCKFQTHILTE